MSIKPITPEEAYKNCKAQIPDFVLDVVNKLLVQKTSRRNRSVNITQSDVIQGITKHPDFPKDASRQSIFDNGWLDFEPLYRKAGWDVTYDKPSYNEDYEAYFTFSPKNS